MKVILDVPSFKVPSDQGPVMASSINELILSVIGYAHDVISVSIGVSL
jgi:hypothetical protein